MVFTIYSVTQRTLSVCCFTCKFQINRMQMIIIQRISSAYSVKGLEVDRQIGELIGLPVSDDQDHLGNQFHVVQMVQDRREEHYEVMIIH